MKRDDSQIQTVLEIMKERLEFITHYLHLTASQNNAQVQANREEFKTSMNWWVALGSVIKEIKECETPDVSILSQLESALDETLRKLREFAESQLQSMKASLEKAKEGKIDTVVYNSQGVVSVKMRQLDDDIGNFNQIIGKLNVDLENFKKAERELVRWAYHGTDIKSIQNQKTAIDDTKRNLLGGIGTPN